MELADGDFIKNVSGHLSQNNQLRHHDEGGPPQIPISSRLWGLPKKVVKEIEVLMSSKAKEKGKGKGKGKAK